ncbi:MAG: MBL fold metallo-hydrolase [Coprobacillus sp.]|nr:MBL fold metallo-hydrolase [Coprobacillus sp.]
MVYSLIASGSKGNSLLIKEGETSIIIDTGIALSRITDELDYYNLKLDDIDAFFYTHNHSDHYIYYKSIPDSKVYAIENAIDRDNYNVIDMYKEIQIGDLYITPIKTIHDCVYGCGYIVRGSKSKLVYLTDTGAFEEENLPYMKNPTYLLLESNHDLGMLERSKRSRALKDRIEADTGHLCNEDSADIARQVVGRDTKGIVLCHISEECNTPELALKAYRKMFIFFGKNINKYNVRCAKQREPLRGGDED